MSFDRITVQVLPTFFYAALILLSLACPTVFKSRLRLLAWECIRTFLLEGSSLFLFYDVFGEAMLMIIAVYLWANRKRSLRLEFFFDVKRRFAHTVS